MKTCPRCGQPVHCVVTRPAWPHMFAYVDTICETCATIDTKAMAGGLTDDEVAAIMAESAPK